jgi:hypothetical protein
MLQELPNVIKAMPPSPHPLVDAPVSLLPTLIAVGGGLWALFKYLSDKRDAHVKDIETKQDANRNAKTEALKPFSEKQQAVYSELLRTTAFIANRITEPEKDPERASAIQNFWILFWGELPLVANQEVAVAADNFSVLLDDPMKFVPLRNASMDLARACRKALGHAWSLDIVEFAKGEASIAKTEPPRR